MNLTPTGSQDELDAEDRAAIEESEQQIARSEDLDWKEVGARLRRKYLPLTNRPLTQRRTTDH